MSSVTFEEQWHRSMRDLQKLVEREYGHSQSSIPHGAHALTCLYIEYLQLVRSLEECYDQVCHPQKRPNIFAALEASTGRMLELKSKVVCLHNNNDFFPIADSLKALGFTPDALGLAIPRCLRDDRSALLEDRQAFFKSIVSERGVSNPSKLLTPTASSQPDADPEANDEQIAQQVEQYRLHDSSSGGGSSLVPIEGDRHPALTQGRTSAQDAVTKRIRSEHDVAATTIQCCWRGHSIRKRVCQKAEQELELIGMKLPSKPNDPQSAEKSHLARRKTLQQQALSEYDKQLVEMKERVRSQEGQDIRETIQDKVNDWLVQKRDPETGDYPEFPDESKGGSRSILDPAPQMEELPEAEQQEQKNRGRQGSASLSTKKSGSSGKGNARNEQESETKVENEDGLPTSHFLEKAESALNEWASVWNEQDESISETLQQTVNEEMTRETVRPLVFEEVRREVDEEIRTLLQNLKQMVGAQRAAKLGKKQQKSGKSGLAKKMKGNSEKSSTSKKSKKDPTSNVSLEELYAELVQQGILKNTPRVVMSDYVGGWPLLASADPAVVADAEPVRVRQAVIESAVLPHLSSSLHANLAATKNIKSVLLYGHSGTGKTLLALAVAYGLGANLIDLSPRNTDGKYTGGLKQVEDMCHKAFKVAKMTAPSVILVDEVEKVFLTGKRSRDASAGLQEQASRIKKALTREMKHLKGGERVVMIGISREPWLAQKDDEKALYNFFNKFFHTRLPNYSDRRALWPLLFKRFGVQLPSEFDLSTLVKLSEGYTPSDIERAVRNVLTSHRMEMLQRKPLGMEEVALQLAKAKPVAKEKDNALRAWEKRVVERKSPQEKRAAGELKV
jgi:SpoVK/Ycf46/Vps4 family AAA+-type ATPase